MEAAVEIRRAMDDLRRGRITEEAYRETMSSLRTQLGEAAYSAAKFRAVASDAR